MDIKRIETYINAHFCFWEKMIIICTAILVVILLSMILHTCPPFDLEELYTCGNSNNSSQLTPNGSLNSVNFGISALIGIVGIVALLMSVLGLFFTLLLMAIGNYRSHFYDTVFKFYNFCRNTGNITPESRQMCIDKYILSTISDRNLGLHASSEDLSNIFKRFTLFSMTILFVILLVIILHFVWSANIWIFIWGIMIVYITFLIVAVYNIKTCIESSMSYPDLSLIQKRMTEFMMCELEKDLNSKKKNDANEKE